VGIHCKTFEIKNPSIAWAFSKQTKGYCLFDVI